MNRTTVLARQLPAFTAGQMMENAGRNLAELTRMILGGSVAEKGVLIGAGDGNNGGGGLIAARHLHNWGADVAVMVPGEKLNSVSKVQLDILERLPVEIKNGDDAIGYLSNWSGDTVLDALIGYGLSGNPRGWVSKIIDSINATGLPTGEVYDPCARATLTLALPKAGLLKKGAGRVTGTIYLADLDIPTAVYNEIGIEVGSPFELDTIVKLDTMLEGMKFER